MAGLVHRLLWCIQALLSSLRSVPADGFLAALDRRGVLRTAFSLRSIGEPVHRLPIF